MFKIFTNIVIICLLSSIVTASEPYCIRNESIIIKTPVTRTRHVIKKPTGAFKMFKKNKVLTEEYQDFEEHVQFRVVRSCCDGYEMSHFEICEPICTSVCPNNARCVEPNRCQCNRGYVSAVESSSGSHYCEPICNGGCPPNAYCVEPDVCECERGYHLENYHCHPRCTSGCPFDGVCISPDECECLEGYKSISGTCVPICTAGDGCLNGLCVEKEKCICNPGYEMNPNTKICERTCSSDNCDEDYSSRIDFESTTNAFLELFHKNQNSDGSIEDSEEEKIYLTTPPTDYTDEVDYSDVPDSTARYSKCPKNYIFYQNKCRPQVFSSNEVDCKVKPCVENAFCQANGTCACNEGYNWYTPYNASAVCLTLQEVEEYLEARSSANDTESNVDWLSAFFIALGVLCMLGALCFLVVKLLRHKNGELEVEVKNDLYCTYDSKNYKEVPLVL